MLGRRLLLVIALGGCLALTAWGPQWPASGGDQSHVQERILDAEQRGSEARPKPASTDAESGQQDGSGFNNQRPETLGEWLGTFIEASTLTNALIMVFTGLLLFVTWRQFKLSERIHDESDAAFTLSKQAADAATDSARALIDFEAPVIFLQNIRCDRGLAVIGSDHGSVTLHLSVGIANYGRTPGIMRALHIEGLLGQLPSVPAFSEDLTNTNVQIIERTGAEAIDHIWDRWTFTLSREELRAVVGGETPFWIFGYLIFEDLMSRRHRYGFCGMWTDDPKYGQRFLERYAPASYRQREIQNRPK